MNKVISFGLWGDKPLYLKGALENLKISKDFYPGWKCRFYLDDSVPSDFIETLKQNGADIVNMGEHKNNWDGLFWRFLPACDKDVDVFIVRDTDSRLNSREVAAVNEWLSSDKKFHCMRDNKHHNVPIMGGMWGCKNPFLEIMGILLKTYHLENPIKGSDQEFLAKYIWPIVANDTLCHDKFTERVFFLGDEIKYNKDVVYYNPYVNCGDEKLYDFPDGMIMFTDGIKRKRLDVYEYNSQKYFGEHEVRPFPPHKPIEYGTYVGEDIKV